MEYDATYGSNQTPCTIFVEDGWYCVDGSVNVNHSYCDFYDGIDVETIEDDDMFTASSPIESEEELYNAIFDE